jgi:anti-sigma B factor antagonist
VDFTGHCGGVSTLTSARNVIDGTCSFGLAKPSTGSIIRAILSRAHSQAQFAERGVFMATNPVPVSELVMGTDRTPTEIIVYCTGKINSNTTQSLKTMVKPLFSASKTVVLDLTNVNYMDSSGLGGIVGLYVSAKAANSELKLIHLNERLKELFSIARLGQFLAEGRDPRDLTPP